MSRYVRVEIRRDGEKLDGLGEVTDFLVADERWPGDTLQFTIQPDIVEPTTMSLRFVSVIER